MRTNNPAVEDSTRITATVIATGKIYPARVVGYYKTGDIALLQLQGSSGLQTIRSATPPPRADAAVVAVGNAEGQGTIIPVSGRVTGLGKTHHRRRPGWNSQHRDAAPDDRGQRRHRVG